ncbi:hypothetical protein GE061_002273 [Apolygus lucorum]|uniref:Uncharacterized protein n=1 Tax=Apolygus lucorum TaxID=248454 RepID=A0A8S9X8N5_APOLU|nr:hypothetical protein GE061_002273 [Apolygus lucorum]
MLDVCLRVFTSKKREHLPVLQGCLEIPTEVHTGGENGYRVPGLTALCLLLRRLSYPNRLGDLERLFGISKSGISAIVMWAIDHINGKFENILKDLRRVRWLNPQKLAVYAEVVTQDMMLESGQDVGFSSKYAKSA